MNLKEIYESLNVEEIAERSLKKYREDSLKEISKEKKDKALERSTKSSK